MIVTLVVAATVVVALGSVKFGQVRAAMAQGASFQPPPEAVTTIVAQRQTWPTTLTSIGTVTAVQGVTVSADLPGIVEQIAFESGSPVAKGAVLVRLDASQEKAQLAAAEAEVEVTALQLERQKGLEAKGITARADLDRAAAAAKQAEAKVKEVRAMIERKTIRAPFAGHLGIRQVNLGQYLDSGSPIVPLQTLDPIFVEFSVPQQEAAGLAEGVKVEVADEGAKEVAATGTISAVDSVVDPATRNVKIQAVFDNPERKLRPGMFVQARVDVGAALPVIALPASAIAYAPYGDSVFVVDEIAGKDGKTYRGARQQFVELGGGRGDQVAVLSGLKDGDEVVTSGVFKLRSGAAVAVDNSVQPSNQAAPEPEDS
jgi:membrane fusion protein (multidrug efflux system)